MTSKSTLKQDDTGKLFKVTLLSHWSDIASDDGDKDRVKWTGGKSYIGCDSGKSYTLLESEP